MTAIIYFEFYIFLYYLFLPFPACCCSVDGYNFSVIPALRKHLITVPCFFVLAKKMAIFSQWSDLRSIYKDRSWIICVSGQNATIFSVRFTQCAKPDRRSPYPRMWKWYHPVQHKWAMRTASSLFSKPCGLPVRCGMTLTDYRHRFENMEAWS